VPLAEELLKPHRCYLRELSALRGAWKAAAHITGGGVLGNLPRCLPEGLGAVLDAGSWRVPPIFGLLARLGSIDDDDMYATFNMGLGMILVIDPDRIPADVPPDLVRVGDVVERRGAQRVVFR
jgi:phosphoribosylformylglycinamidine cyclo-ligase